MNARGAALAPNSRCAFLQFVTWSYHLCPCFPREGLDFRAKNSPSDENKKIPSTRNFFVQFRFALLSQGVEARSTAGVQSRRFGVHNSRRIVAKLGGQFALDGFIVQNLVPSGFIFVSKPL
jgi:hypothetical protein